jgi:hypothetical protein
MATRSENVEPLAIAEKDSGLIFSHDQLSTELDLGRALSGIAVQDFDASIVEPLDDFHEFRHEFSFSSQSK